MPEEPNSVWLLFPFFINNAPALLVEIIMSFLSFGKLYFEKKLGKINSSFFSGSNNSISIPLWITVIFFSLILYILEINFFTYSEIATILSALLKPLL